VRGAARRRDTGDGRCHIRRKLGQRACWRHPCSKARFNVFIAEIAEFAENKFGLFRESSGYRRHGFAMAVVSGRPPVHGALG
jgi:hypothetical protein